MVEPFNESSSGRWSWKLYRGITFQRILLFYGIRKTNVYKAKEGAPTLS